MLLLLNTNELIFLIIWIFVGSILGFFAFTFDRNVSISTNICKCCLSISFAILTSFTICQYLLENGSYSKSMSILLSGLAATGIPDIITRYWKRISHRIVDIFCGNLVSKYQKD